MLFTLCSASVCALVIVLNDTIRVKESENGETRPIMKEDRP
jgi:hypothetical protein